MPIKNITSDSNVNVNSKGDIIPADEDTRIHAPNVNLTSSKNIATRANPLTINADNTTLRAKYAYIIGNYGNINAAGTNFESMNRASGGEEKSPIFWTPTTTPTTAPTVNRPVSNTAVESLLTPNFTLLTGIATPATTANSEYYKMALLLSERTTLMSKSGEAYDSAAKAWLNGMGYNESEKQQIINLAREIAFKNLSSTKLLNDGIADIVAKYSAFNISAKSIA